MFGLMIKHPSERRMQRCFDYAWEHPGTLRGALAEILGDHFDKRLVRWRRRNIHLSVNEVLSRHPGWRRA